MGRGADIAIRFITQGVDKARQQMNKFSGATAKVTEWAKKGAVAIGVALAVAVVKAAKAFIDFDDAMNQSLAIMKTTIDQQERMKSVARELATTTRMSAKDSAESYFFLASAGLDAEQSIAALPQVAKFAQAGMFDMATATDLATDAQSALGLTVKDAEQNLNNLTRVTDVLVKANTLANASVQQFSEALTTKSGAALKVVNKDIEEGVAVLAAFADRGVKGAEAGDKLNQVLRDIPRATAKNGEEFEKLGLNMFNAEGNMKNVADIVEELDAVLGPMSDELKASTLDQLGLNRGVADAVKILSGAGDQIREYEKQLRGAGGATQEVADNQMESLQAKIDVMNSNFTELGLVIMEKAAPAIEWIVEKTTSLLKILTDTIETTEEETKAWEEATAKSHLYGDSIDNLHGSYDKYEKAVDEASMTQDDFDEVLRRTEMSWLSSKDAQADARTEVERYNQEVGNTAPAMEEVIEKTKEQIEKEKELAEQRRNAALPSLMSVIDAQKNLKEIYEEQNDLLEKREDAVTKLNKAQEKEKKANEKLEKAKAKVNEVAGLGKEITDEEALAILRQKKRVEELTAEEDKSEIQKLELAVAINKLNELEEKSVALSREEIDAARELKRAEEEVVSAEEKRIEAQEKLNEATKEYNDATAKTPENLLRIANAKKDLDDAIADMKSMNLFTEGIEQMVEMGLGSFKDLADGFRNLVIGAKSGNFDFGGGGSTTGSASGGSETFDPLGNPLPDSPAVVNGGVGSGTGVTGNVTTITNITANVDAALTDRAGIELAIANALIQAQKKGIKVIL